MSVNAINKPFLYNNWYVFPDTVITNMDMSECNNTITGECLHTPSLQKCIDICANNSACKYGYYIGTPDNKNICVPLLDKKEIPYFQLRHKNYYPVMKNLRPYVFSSKEYEFPPDTTNTIFYSDNFILQDTSTNYTLNTTKTNSSIEHTIFSDSYTLVQLIPSNITNDFIENYVAVKNGDEVSINIPFTSFILKKDGNNNEIVWATRASTVAVPENTFRIYSSNPEKKIGDALNFSETFIIKFQEAFLFYNKENNIIQISDNQKSVFKLIPKVEVSYCDKNRCKTISLDKTDMKGSKSTYKGFATYRSPTCWNMCNGVRKWYDLLILIILIMVIYFLYRYLRRR